MKHLDWAWLLVGTVGLSLLLRLTGLPSAILLGAMGAAIALAVRGASLKLPAPAFTLAQATVGCLMARAFTVELMHSLWSHLLLFALVASSVLLLATSLGLLLARLEVLPGSTALWGSFPGAATAMVVLSGEHGADLRLVALMQYLRVVVVAVVASVVAWLAGAHPAAAAAGAPWLGLVRWPELGVTVLLIAAGGLGVPRVWRGGALVGTLALGTVAQVGLGLSLELPPPLLAAAYAAVGWAVGLRFSADLFVHAARVLPRVLAAIAFLVSACAGLAWLLSRFAGLDLLTAYFATSPGGADTVAILTAGAAVDVPLVMAIQIGRSVTVMLVGPALARWAVRFTPAQGRDFTV